MPESGKPRSACQEISKCDLLHRGGIGPDRTSEADKQATIMLSLITDHGRATPLVWLTVDKHTLKNNRSLYEHRVLRAAGDELAAPPTSRCAWSPTAASVTRSSTGC